MVGINRLRRRFERLEKLAAVTFLATLAISAGALDAQAAEDSYGGFDYYFHVDRLEIERDHCVAAATINYDSVRSHMSVIRDEWLSKDNTTEFYQRETLGIIFGIVDHKAGGVLLEIVYKEGQTKNPDKCHFSLSLAKADD